MENMEPIENENLVVEEEPKLFDIIVGVLSEPSNLFEKLKKFPVRVMNWLIPVLIFLVVGIIMNIYIMSNPEFSSEIFYKQKKAAEERIDKMVQEGKLSKAEAEQQKESVEKGLSMFKGSVGIIISVISMIVVTFIMLFVLSLLYWVIWTKILGGNGTYPSALLVNGIAFYISIIEIICILIFTIILGKVIDGISIVTFIEMEEGLLKFVLSKLNPFTIWSLAIIGIGLGKVYSVEIKKSMITIFSLWVLYLIVSYLLKIIF